MQADGTRRCSLVGKEELGRRAWFCAVWHYGPNIEESIVIFTENRKMNFSLVAFLFGPYI